MRALMCALLLGAGASTALAATLQPLQGRVQLNGKFGSATRPVKAGDVITAGANSSARIVFSDGCVVGVAALTTVTVPSSSPCVVASDDFTVGSIAVVGAAAGAAVILSQDDDDRPASP